MPRRRVTPAMNRFFRSAQTQPIEWADLSIQDFTAGQPGPASLARMGLRPGARHVMAWSKRSDKYYYLVAGQIHFWLDGQTLVLSAGDGCRVPAGGRFAYANRTNAPADLLVLNVPAFEMEAEVLAEHYFAQPRIYHLLSRSDWARAAAAAEYRPATFAQDGFIHCCDGDQLVGIRQRYFQGQPDMLVLQIDSLAVRAPIKYEDLAAEGAAFPHIYGALNQEAIRQVVAWPSGGNLGLPPDLEPEPK